MIIAPTLILLTLAIASFSAGGYSMFQQYLQQTFSDSISDKAQVTFLQTVVTISSLCNKRMGFWPNKKDCNISATIVQIF